MYVQPVLHIHALFVVNLQLCRKVWLGLHNNQAHFLADHQDEQKIKDFMALKYEKKRFYVAPTDHMLEQARVQNTPAKAEPTSRPLRPLGQVPKLAQNSIIVSQVKQNHYGVELNIN